MTLSGECVAADCLVLGAGPAGLMCAAQLAELAPEAHIVVIDHAKKPARKLMVSGAGQCNFTHDGSIKEYVTHYGEQGSRIRKVLYGFSNQEVRSWFAARGVSSFAREDGKVFPESLKSGDVLTALLRAVEQGNGSVVCEVSVKRIALDDGNHFVIEADTPQGNITFQAKNLVVATGGITYPSTGSDGSIIELIAPLLRAHNICLPDFIVGLAPLYPRAYPFGELEGLSLEVRLEASVQKLHGKNAAAIKGLLLRSDSFSGPAAQDMSTYLTPGQNFFVNFAPHLLGDAQTIGENLFTQAHVSQKELLTLLVAFFGLPKRFVATVLNEYCVCTGLNLACDPMNLSKAHCRAIARQFVEAQFCIECRASVREGMVSRGGFLLDDINLASMTLKNMPAISVAGECVDVQGDTGGYNLQWAFSSGACAGRALAQKLTARE